MKKLLLKITFRNKILTVLLLVTILLSGFSLILVQSIEDVSQVSYKINRENIPELLWLSQWEKGLTIREYEIHGFLDNNTCCDFINTYENLGDLQVEGKFHSLPESLLGIQKEIELLDFLVVNNVQGLVEFGDIEEAKEFLQTTYIPKLDIINSQIKVVRAQTLDSLTSQSNRFSVIIEDSLWLLLLLTIGAITISIFVSYRISASLTQPLDKLVVKVDSIANGQYGLTLKEPHQYELQHLTNSINQMSLRLKDSFNTIMEDKIYQKQILNSLPVGIITVDDESMELTFNTSAKKFLQMDEDSFSHLKSEYHSSENILFWELLDNKQICQNQKVKFENGDRTLHFLVSQSELFDQYQNVIGRILYFIDITETEELEKRMHQTEKLALVGEIAASAAHEIRNPLTVIHGLLSLMNKKLSDRDKEDFHLSLLIKELDRINFIIEEMLLHAKPGAPIFREVYIEAVLEEILPLIKQSADIEGINFKIDLHRKLLLLDEKQIKQVLYNLVRNSIEAMGGRGDIFIYSNLEHDTYQIYLKDTGPGIPLDVQNSLFEPFVTTKNTGSGLGLTIVQRIVENHGGTIEVQSSERNGTVFIINLPLNEGGGAVN